MTFESLGGRASLELLYERLADHPKSKKNPHYKERIRATLHEHQDQYIPEGGGEYRLRYKVA